MNQAKHLLIMSAKVFRKRGIISLFFDIWQYSWGFTRILFMRSGDVLYVSGCPGGSFFYRCQNQAEELLQYGIKSAVVSQNNLGLSYITKKFKVFVFQRVIYNDRIGRVIRKIEEQGKKVIFETDDLVFDPQYISQMHYRTYMNEEERGWYENGIGREILEDKYVSHCIVSTKYLAEMLKKKYSDKTIFISKNKLNARQVKYANDALKNAKKIKKDDGNVRIGYFSGSKSHDNDFDTITDILVRVLKENANAVLMIVGHLKLNGKFAEVKNQIEYHSFVPMKKLPELILMADINVAPLEIDNPFCQGKSELKFFEAGIVGVPTIATATQSYKDVIVNGKNGFTAKDNAQWHEYLSKLIEDKKFRLLMGKQARITVLENYTTSKKHVVTTDFAKFLKENFKTK